MENIKQYPYRAFLCIFLLAVFVRILLFSAVYEHENYNLYPSFPASDGYYTMAQNLLAGRGLSEKSSPPFSLSAHRTPLYPLFISGIVYLSESYWGVLVVQIILGGFIPVLGWLVTKRIFVSQKLATTTALILAAEPFSASLSSVLLTETLFTFLFLFAMIFFFSYLQNERYRNIILASIFLGLITLTRPTTLYLPAILIFFLLWRWGKRLSFRSGIHLTTFLVFFFLVLSPWLYRNYRLFHVPIISTTSTQSLYFHLVPSAIALDNHIGLSEMESKFLSDQKFTYDDIVPKNTRKFQTSAFEILKKHPYGLMQSLLITAVTFFTHDGYLEILNRLGFLTDLRIERPSIVALFESPQQTTALIQTLVRGPAAIIIVGRLIWIAITVSFFYGAFRYLRSRDRRPEGMIALICIAFFMLTTAIIGLGVYARFRVPVNTFILAFAVYGLFYGWNDIATRLKNKKFCPQKIS